MKRLKINILIIAYCLLSIADCFPQTPVFKTLVPLKGEKNLEIYSFLQDNEGHLWLGTSKGLIQYNGLSFQFHIPGDSAIENEISSLCMDSSSSFWLGHPGGALSVFKNKNFKKFEPDEGTPVKKITSIRIDKKGTLWFGTYGEGIYFYDGSRVSNINADDGLSDNVVYDICITQDGIVWAGTDGGITIINPGETDKSKKLTKLSMKDGLPDNIVKSIVQDEEGNLWLGMQDMGICKYDVKNKKFETGYFPNGWSFGPVNTLLLDKFGNLWIATDDNGLVKFSISKKYTRKYNTAHGLASNKILSLFYDRENNLWIGTSSGLNQYSGDRFEFITQKDGLPSANIYTFLHDTKGNYWMGTEQGLVKFSYTASGDAIVKKFGGADGLSHEHVVSLFEDKEGNIWAGTYGGGACKLNPLNNSIRNYSEKNSALANDNIMSITADKEGNIWFATLGNGVSKLHSNGAFQNFSSTDGIGSDYVYFVFCDSKNNMWFATDGGGAAKFDGKEFKTYSKNEGLSSETVFSVAEDKKGNIWLSTSGGGIAKFDPAKSGAGGNKFEIFSSQNGLRDDAPPVLAFDGNENIVIAHKNGIDKLGISTHKFSYYGSDEGLVSFEPNTNACHLDKDGIIWLGTSNGVVKYNPAREISNQAEPLTQLTRFRVLTRDIEFGKSSEFSHDENNVTFDFIGVSLTSPSKVRYKYKLEEFDKDWSEETELNTKNYPYLPHGKYKFMVMACNNEGVWNKIPVSYEFVIRPPFWVTWWFWTLLLATLGSASYLYTKWKLRQIEAEKRILENKVKERTAEVVKQKEIIEQKNKDITDSINYAKRIQEAILPSEQLIYKHFPQSFVLYQPKDIVSGDFYWFSSVKINNRNICLIAAADCTGHGVPGAFMSMIGNTTLNQIVNEKKLTEPAKVLTDMNEAIKVALRQNENDSQSRDGMDVALCAIDIDNRELHFSGAYRPLYRIRKNEGYSLEEIKGDKFPVGGLHLKNERIFTNYTFSIKKDETIYICSDGYADQFGGPEKRKFMTKRFKELLLSVQDSNMQEQKVILERKILDWKNDLEQMDDILVIGIRF